MRRMINYDDDPIRRWESTKRDKNPPQPQPANTQPQQNCPPSYVVCLAQGCSKGCSTFLDFHSSRLVLKFHTWESDHCLFASSIWVFDNLQATNAVLSNLPQYTLAGPIKMEDLIFALYMFMGVNLVRWRMWRPSANGGSGAACDRPCPKDPLRMLWCLSHTPV